MTEYANSWLDETTRFLWIVARVAEFPQNCVMLTSRDINLSLQGYYDPYKESPLSHCGNPVRGGFTLLGELQTFLLLILQVKCM